MQDKLYQFVTLVYNHEDLIENHLDSILFQKMTFGLDKKVVLTLFDDFSSDKSVEVIERWLAKKSKYFHIVKVVKNYKNLGIKLNYLNSLKFIVTDRYKLLGGDDLFLNHSNIFDFMDYARDKEVVFSPMLVNGFYTFKQQVYLYKLHFYQSRQLFLSRILVKFNPFAAPGAYISLEILKDEHYLKFLSEATEDFEDWPSWKFIFLNSKFNYGVYKTPIVNYRPSSSRRSQEQQKFVAKKTKHFKWIFSSLRKRVIYKYFYILLYAQLFSLYSLLKNKCFSNNGR